MPEVHLDYCFFEKSAWWEECAHNCLEGTRCAVERMGLGVGSQTRRKGSHQVVNSRRRFFFFLKCGQEEALKNFVNQLTKLRNAIPGVRTVVEHSPVRESQSNGFIEAGVKTVEGMVRTMKLNLEHHMHECIEVDHPILYWLVEHAADVSTKFQKGVDGKTAYERLKGKPNRGEIREFGCQVHHRVPRKTQGGLLAARWHTGVWLGKRFAS